MVLMLWINGYRHDFTTDEGFDLVVGVAARKTELQHAATLISKHMILK
jgi:death-on-curing protein